MSHVICSRSLNRSCKVEFSTSIIALQKFLLIQLSLTNVSPARSTASCSTSPKRTPQVLSKINSFYYLHRPEPENTSQTSLEHHKRHKLKFLNDCGAFVYVLLASLIIQVSRQNKLPFSSEISTVPVTVNQYYSYF